MPEKYTGLTTQEVKHKLSRLGANALPEDKNTFLKKLLKNILSPISIMLMVAAFLSFLIGKTFDGNFILVFLLLNVSITLWQERKADSAIKKLNEHLAQEIYALRDGKWILVVSTNLVVDDIIRIKLGDVIPADGELLEAHNVSANEASLTGESLPKDKKEGDKVYSGSFLVTGLAVVRVTATGKETSFGRTVFKIERTRKESLLERDIIKISKFLAALSLVSVLILTVVFIFQKYPLLEILTLDLSVIIAGIPISLPTVMTLITELGVLNLAKKSVIVRRISSLEDLSNVNYLLTDKTGTLTKNKIEINEIYTYGDIKEADLLRLTSLVASQSENDPIDAAILRRAADTKKETQPPEDLEFIPADSNRKRSTIYFKLEGKETVISLGAPQIMEQICDLDRSDKEKFDQDVDKLALSGYRTLAVAFAQNTKEEKRMKIIGLFALSDAVRPEAKSVVQFLIDNGIDVSMVTGDNDAIASEIAIEVALGDKKVVTKTQLDKLSPEDIDEEFFLETGAFAEVLPEDKLELVQKAKELFTVAVTGDGINDLPALKSADVGIAVSNAVNVLKSAADIVLLSDGIHVIRDAIIESRKIFARIYTYSLYRISESFRLVVTLAILGIIFKAYPLNTLQIILIALLNDLPIISLAFDRVKIANRPARLNFKNQISSSVLFGLAGIVNSLLVLLITVYVWHLDWSTIQTIYFLKLTVSGHMLIYVAHTKGKWFDFLPSREVIIATTLTQAVATILAITGFLMPAQLSLPLVIFVWGWSFLWMQISEYTKDLKRLLFKDTV